MQRILVTLGLLILMAGLAWPWLMRLGLGRLPGDIRVERDGFGFYFPLTTSIVVSLLVTLVFWLLRK
ncbi:MAG: hypothetical protein AMXMBFR8_16650 [Nevskiales bacterium]